MSRAPRQVLSDHLAALNSHDPERVVADYSPDAVLVLPGTVAEGADAIRTAFADVFAQLPHAVFAEKSATEAADVVLLEWTLEADGVVADDGIDTLVVRDGLIHAQTARFTPRPR